MPARAPHNLEEVLLLSTLKLLSTAELVDLAKVEMLVVYMNSLMNKAYHILLVNNMLPKMEMENVLPLKSAKIAPGHHAQRAKIAKTNVGLSNKPTTITLLITTVSEQRT
jgi:hypothetical protein